MVRIRVVSIVVFILGILFMVLGLVVRAISFYWFWDSLLIGWWVFVLGIILYLLSLVMAKNKNRSGRPVFSYILLGLVSFAAILQVIVALVLNFSSVSKVAINEIQSNANLTSQFGESIDYSVWPIGRILEDGDKGEATIIFTLKGSKKYMDTVVLLQKDSATWVIR